MKQLNKIHFAMMYVLTLVTSIRVQAAPLKIVATHGSCPFSTNCVVSVTDSLGTFHLNGVLGDGRLQSRTYVGQSGAPLAGLYAYVYRVDLTSASVSSNPGGGVVSLRIRFGTPLQYDFDADGSNDDVFYHTDGLGTVAPAAADLSGDQITFTFNPGVFPGQSSFFFGMVSARPPEFLSAAVTETTFSNVLSVDARAPSTPASRYYVGPDGGVWNSSVNWSPTFGGLGGAGVPAPGDTALLLGNTPKTVNFDSAYISPLAGLTVDGSGGARMTLNQFSDLTRMYAHDFLVGRDGQGRYVQSGGNVTIDRTLANDARLELGGNAGSVGTYDMSGGAINIDSLRFNGGLIVGQFGEGIFNLNNGVVTVNAVVGIGNGGRGTFNHSGGSLTLGSGRSMFIGRVAGSHGTYNLSGNASVSLYGGNLQLGYEGNGNFIQNGGVVLLESPDGNAGHVIMANAASASGSYTLNNGTLSARSVRVGGDVSSSGGAGTLTVNGGTVHAALQVWNNGSVLLNGGSIDVGSDPVADNIRNDGIIINNGGSLIVGGRIYGTGEIVQSSGAASFADAATIDIGGVTIAGGTATAAGNLLVGRNTGSTGILNVTGGSLDVSNGVLGVGNGGSLTTGNGHGSLTVANAVVTAASIQLGSANGGSGDMTIDNGGDVTVLGGLTLNDGEVKQGGRLRVLYNPAGGPSFEDPNLHNRILAGYLRDGALNVTGGTVSAPEIVVGLSNGNGTLTMSSGSVTATGNVLVGVDASATGTVNLTGGTLDVSHGVLGVGNAGSLTTGNGHGSVTVANSTVTAASIQLGSANGGSGDMTIDNGGDVTVLGGFSVNDAEIKQGGRLRVLHNPLPFSFEDPILHDRIVGGYLRDGALAITGGTVSTPEMLLGVTTGKTGTLTVSSGTLTMENNLVVGDCVTGAGGMVTVSGGTIYVTNASHTATLRVRRGSFVMTGGTLFVDRLIIDSGCATFTRTGGALIITDVTPPEIHCPANILTGTDAGQCSAVVNFTVTATDNSGSATVVCSPASGSRFPVGTMSVVCSATDASGNRATCSFTVTVDNPAPSVTITSPPSGAVSPVGAAVTFTGTFTDNAGDTHTAQWMIDATSVAGTVDEARSRVTASRTFVAPGVYLVKLTVTDDCANWGAATTVDGLPAMVVIYDPNGSFVTGGGWINSPPGAYTPQPNLTGKASFGFVSKYAKGATVPTGETEFQFQVANLNFQSSTYQWLVVSGPLAQFKGTGQINGAGNYGFLLTATDGQVSGGGGTDKFRIKIWDINSGGTIFYDNVAGVSDDINGAKPQSIAGGSIVIHK